MPNEKLTIGYINHDPAMFENCLGKSLSFLDPHQYDVICTSDKNYAAKNYNTIAEQSNNRYIVLAHQDVYLAPDFIKRVHGTISQQPDFGVLGIVGFFPFESSNRYTVLASSAASVSVDFFDSLCIVINKDNNLRFDEVDFDEYHLYVEDYCMQAIERGLKNYTLMIDWWTVRHFESTYMKNGKKMWGRYDEYYHKFMKKWLERLKKTPLPATEQAV